MANTQGMTNNFKSEVMLGTHVLGTDALKAALYLASATIGPAQAAYTPTGEVSGANYVAGGVAVASANPPAQDGTIGHFTPSAPIVFNNVTLASPFDCLLLYNSAKANKAIGAFTFGSQTVTAGNFTVNMPTNDGTTGLVRIA